MPFLFLDLVMFIVVIYFLCSKGNYMFKIAVIVGVLAIVSPGIIPFFEGILKILWEIILAVLF